MMFVDRQPTVQTYASVDYGNSHKQANVSLLLKDSLILVYLSSVFMGLYEWGHEKKQSFKLVVCLCLHKHNQDKFL